MVKSLWILIISLISALCILSQEISLDQPPSLVIKPSESARLPCKVSVAVSSYYWDWVRQLPGKGLEYIGRISSGGSPEPASAFRNRITLTRDTSKNELHLSMSSMRSEDSGLYYCTRDAQCEKDVRTYDTNAWKRGT
uniref:Ig-like domain-containing protein n=1 Tax=Leptobrachium leishanense TaxID=445787 RepID=A0A8C5PB71_9ANUR